MENRETFFARLTPFMPPSKLRNIEVAYMMAKFAHRAQVRKDLDQNGDPVRYFEHLRRVALLLIDNFEVRDWRMICAALLHDSLEDTKDITAEIIEHLFGAEVCRMVQLLSKCPKEGYFQRLKSFGDERVFLIKGCDRLDNLNSMESVSREFVVKQLKETRNVYLPLWESLDNSEFRKLGLKIHIRMNELKNSFQIKEEEIL